MESPIFLSYSQVVMLNLFQHLKKIPKQVRDDTKCVFSTVSKEAYLDPEINSG